MITGPNAATSAGTGTDGTTIEAGTAAVASFTADETVTWTLAGTDAALFDISTAGVLTLKDPGVVDTYVVDITAEDADGNISILTFTLIVEDTTQPVITGPNAATSAGTGTDGTTIEAGTTAVASFTADETVTWTLAGTDAALFDISTAGVLTLKDPGVVDTYVVDITAEDADGNISILTFTLIVEDTTQPVITGPNAATSAGTGTDGTTIEAGTTAVASFTADETVTWTLAGTDAALFDISTAGVLTLKDPGVVDTYVVDITAEDADGNISILTFTLIVEDTTQPVITGPNAATSAGTGTDGTTIEAGTTAVASFTADETVTWTLAGTDAALFDISTAGVLTLKDPGVVDTYVVDITAEDADGNISILTFTLIVEDTTQPVITGPNAATSAGTGTDGTTIEAGTTAVASFTADETVTWTLAGTDAALFDISTAGVLTLKDPGVVDTYVVDITAEDADGNISILTFTLIVEDTTQPVITGPNAATSAGTGTDGTTIEAGTTAVASFTADETVTWTLAGTDAALFDISTAGVLTLKDPGVVDTYVVDITAEDADGNISILTFTLIVEDTTQPVITGPNAATSAGTGTDGTTIEAGTTAVASFTADETVTWTLAGTDAALFDISTAGVLTLKDPGVVDTYVVDITAEDADGNISILTFTLIVEDTTQPVITGPNAATSAGTGTDGTTIEAGTTAVASFTADETVTWTLAGTDAALFDISTAGVLTLKDPGVVDTYVVDITAEDADGNISILTFTLIVEDTTQPVITGPNAATSAGTGTDGTTIEAGTTAVASFTADETVTWTLAGTDAALFDISTAGVLTLKDPGVVDTYVVDITAEDADGNISILTFTLIVEDTTQPVITGPNAATSAGTGTDGTTIEAGTTAVASFTADETVTWTLAGTDAALFDISTAGVLTLKDPGVVDTYVVDITAEDADGNISILTFTLIVEDTTQPVITGPNAATSAGTGTDGTTIEAGTTAVASFTADETVTWTLAGTDAALFDISTAGVLTLKDPGVVDTYVVDITAEDADGNISILTFTLIVEDTTQPVITGPNAATSAGTGTDGTTIEAGTTAVASFTADETVTWTLAGTDAALFDISTAGVLTLKDPGVVDTYVVDITAEDADGNISILTFTLIVEDTTQPVITGPNAATSAGTGTDGTTIEAGTTAVASFTADETVTWTLAGTDAALFDISTAGVLTLKDPGVVDTYVVDITAEDADGNISILTFTLIVEDTTQPVITGPNAATSAGTGTDGTTIEAGTTAVASFTADETVTWTLAGTDAALFDISTAGVLTLKDPGVVDTYVVDITAEDADGNISILTFTLIVEDTTQPVITGPNAATSAGTGTDGTTIEAGTTAVASFTADETVTWTLAGTDAALFDISTAGVLTLKDPGVVDTYVVDITAEDADGNISILTFTLIVEDTTQPVITGPNAATSAGTGTDGTTIEAGTTAVASFTADETVTWTLAGTDAALFDISTAGVLTLKDPGVVDTYVVDITAEDADGNISILTFTLIVEDTTQPVITGPNAATSAGTGTDGTTIEAGTTAVASFTADETVTWTLAGTDAALFDISTAGVLTLKDPGVVDTYVVDITAEDADGNISILTFTLIVEDTTQPVITGPNAATSAGTGTDGTTIEAGTTAVASFTADETVTWTLAGTDAALFDISTAGVLTLKDPGVVDTYVVDITAEDADGNISILTFTLIVEDTTQPVITGPNAATSAGTGTDGTTIEAGTTAVASFTADETVTWTLAGTDAALFDISTAGVLTLKDPGVVDTYVVDITAEDADGNISILTFTLIVEDTTQPVITGPNAATSAGTGTDGTTIEAGTTAVASFTADETVTWTLAGTDAALFDISTAGVLTLKDPGVVDTYVVDITAEDADGNISILTFTLIVERATYIEAEADKSTGIANSADAVEITVTLTDENNLPVIGKAVELTTDFGTLFINPSGKTVLTRDNGDGTYTAFLRSAEPGEATITVTIDGVDQLNQLFVEFILIDETGSALSASPSEIRANGLDTSRINVSLYDAEGSPLAAGGDTVVLTSTLGILSSVTDNGNGTYSATLTAGTEVGVATVSGTVNGIAIAEPTTVRFAEYQQAVQDAFTDVTSAFVHRRMDRILSAEPRFHHLDRRREATSAPQFSLEYQRNSGELASRLQLAGTLGDMPRGSLDVTGSEASPSSFLRFSGNASSANRNWYFWTEGHYSVYQDATGTIAQRDGGFGIVFLGVDYLVNERLSFGVMAHADRASERIDSYSEVSGNGWMVGPYLSAEVAEDLFFSGRVAWGQSMNSASIDVFSDNTEWRGNFGTERFLVRGALYGSYELGRARLIPQVDLAYMRERQEDYAVSDGVSEVPVAGIEAEVGRLTFSTEIEWPVETTIGTLSAFAIPRLDWDFHTSAPNGQSNQTRGSLEFGLRTTPDSRWSGEAAIRYDGIGQSGFNAWNLRLGAQLDF